MRTSEYTVARAKCRAICRELRKRRCDNFRVVGVSVAFAVRRAFRPAVSKEQANREFIALTEEK
jgi:hypothetical protein